MHLHILGICGTFMAGVAVLARALGHRVSGSDAGAYPPMSEQLAAAGIEVHAGYEAAHLEPAPDLVVVGNALTRGVPAIEHMLDRDLPFTSGPAWLREQALRGRMVLAVAGTHGKTTTASLLAHALDRSGRAPGFLIGGLPGSFGISARLGAPETPFVVEADEYDSAFFDKRSKFVHYRPQVLVVNNLEYDHADIFPDLAAIQRQFHHLLRTIPGRGRILVPAADRAVDEVLAMGCWTPVERFGAATAEWHAELLADDGSRFRLLRHGESVGEVEWALIGRHNVDNAVAAIAAGAAAGLEPRTALATLASFPGIRRRLEWRGEVRGITVYDDFAHHPTAIRATLAALRARVGRTTRILAVLDPASNTMRSGVHQDTLGPALAGADRAWLHRGPRVAFDPQTVVASAPCPVTIAEEVPALVAAVAAAARPGDQVLVMSNGGFGGLPGRLLEALDERDPG